MFEDCDKSQIRAHSEVCFWLCNQEQS